ncbi:Proline iminopeptidase [Lentilactobacillus hilgardii]|nr:proline-specific peptidase [Lentilactobacillus buchneri ATCC 11577]QIR08661.1 Proline iminopeptidase [Lentilactobacillus hilgardii]
MSMIDNIDEYTVHINQLREETFSPFEVDYMKTVERDERFNDPKYQELVAKLYKLYVNRHPERMPRHLVETMAAPVYNHFQGNNEFVMVGTLNGWDRRKDIHNITNPTLLTFGDHDTMPLATAKSMNNEIPSSRLVLTPDGGHCHSVDNPKAFFKTLGEFIENVEDGSFK